VELTAVDVGDGAKAEAQQANECGKYAGAEITIDGQEYLILGQDEVLGILALKA
jgi:co-chaperonin GroES (HSP10)